MSVQVVIHRGFKNILYDNSIVGILLAIFKQQCCELDILFVDGQWKICHDFGVLSVFNINLSVLLKTLAQYRHRVKNNIIIDVKWDYINNRGDDMDYAIMILKSLLDKDLPFWLQAANPHMLSVFIRHGLDHPWKLGMIVYDLHQFDQCKFFVHYVMIPMFDLSPQDIQTMSLEKMLYGYTCNLSDISIYKHLLPYLQGIVCDISI